MIGRSAPAITPLGALLVFIMAITVHVAVLDMALLGWDTYATIAASRITSPADLAGTFSEVLMDGRLPFGDFYRPVGNLFIALDYAAWGLDPFGYQLSNLVLWSLTAALLFVLIRRIAGDRAFAGPFIAVVLYLLHPAVLSILPVVARRTETLQIAFALLALIALPTTTEQKSNRRYWASAACAALAVGSKETGVIVMPLLFVHQFVLVGTHTFMKRTGAVLRSLLPAIVLVSGVLLARFLVIGGLGGYHQEPSLTLVERIVSGLPRYVQTITVTGWPGRSSAASLLSMIVIALIISIAAWLFTQRRPWPDDARCRVATLAAIGITWLLVQVGLACLSFQFSARYVVGMVAGVALLLAALLEGARLSTASEPATQRVVAIVASMVVAGAMLPAIAGSPLWYDYPGLTKASRIQTRELEALEKRLREQPLGRGFPVTLQKQVAIPEYAVDHAWMLSPWGLQAWLEMTFPDKPVKVGISTRAGASRTHWHLALMPVEKQ